MVVEDSAARLLLLLLVVFCYRYLFSSPPCFGEWGHYQKGSIYFDKSRRQHKNEDWVTYVLCRRTPQQIEYWWVDWGNGKMRTKQEKLTIVKLSAETVVISTQKKTRMRTKTWTCCRWNWGGRREEKIPVRILDGVQPKEERGSLILLRVQGQLYPVPCKWLRLEFSISSGIFCTPSERKRRPGPLAPISNMNEAWNCAHVTNERILSSGPQVAREQVCQGRQ